MANTLTSILPKLLTRALPTLRENAVMPQLVTTYSSPSASNPGQNIDVPVPVAQTAAAITNSNTPPANTDVATSTVQIQLTSHYGTNFHLSDSEVTRIDADGLFVPMQLAEAVRALANQVDSDLLGLSTSVYNHVGTAGTTPFHNAAHLNTVWQKGARKKMNQNLAPSADRHIVVDEDAEGNIGSLDQFVLANERGDQGGIISGTIGTKLGADWFMNQNVPTHDTAGPASYLINSASVAIGDSSVAIDGGSNTPAVGDVFTVAGDTQQYVVSSYGSSTLGFAPTAKVAWADNAALTFVTTDSVSNLAFQSGAFAMASAELAGSDFGLGNVQSIVDEKTGLVLRLEVRRDYKQTTWELDVLYGVKAIRPELAVRIFG